MREFKITADAIKNIVTLLQELPFKNTAHLMKYESDGKVSLNGVSRLDVVNTEKKDGNTGNKNKQ